MANNHSEHHITPLSTYLKVAGALFILTFLTIGFHSIRQYLGPLAPIIAFLIAGVKAFLVLAWFMHLKYDEPMNRIIFATGFIFLLVLFGFSAIDIFTRVTETSVL